MIVEAQCKLDELKRQLRTVQTSGSLVRQDLYSHLSEIINRINQFHAKDGFERFEEISVMIKQTHFQVLDPKFDHQINACNGKHHDEA